MAIDFVDVMKSKIHQALYSDEVMDFNAQFDRMQHLPLRYYVPPDVPYKIERLATSLKYSDRIKEKKDEIRNILYPYGFRKFGTGTNRLTFQHVEDHSFLVKVAFDRVGMDNNPAEARNSYLLKPFMPKVFDVAYGGSISLTERVQPVTCWAEAKSIAPDIFDLIIYHIIGKYVAADIGSKYYMNWGVRYGFGPVILDLTDLFELDGKKLHCNWRLPDGSRCGGEIDYDDGFNNLICNKCGHIYEARELAKKTEGEDAIIIKGGNNTMAIRVFEGDKELYSNPAMTENILPRAGKRRKPQIRQIDRAHPISGIRIVVGDEEIKNNPHVETSSKKPEKPAMKIRIEGIEPKYPKSVTVENGELYGEAINAINASIPTPTTDQVEALKNFHAPEGNLDPNLVGELQNAVGELEKVVGDFQDKMAGTEKLEETNIPTVKVYRPGTPWTDDDEDQRRCQTPTEQSSEGETEKEDSGISWDDVDSLREEAHELVSSDDDQVSDEESPNGNKPIYEGLSEDEISSPTESTTPDDDQDAVADETPENDSAAEYASLQKDEDFVKAMRSMSMVDGGKV